MFEKIKDIWRRSSGRNPIRISVLILTLIFFAFICFNPRDSLFRWIEAGFTLRRQERQIERYERENKALDNKINSLSTNRDSLETYARENFYFSEPDEDVYILNEKQN